MCAAAKLIPVFPALVAFARVGTAADAACFVATVPRSLGDTATTKFNPMTPIYPTNSITEAIAAAWIKAPSANASRTQRTTSRGGRLPNG